MYFELGLRCFLPGSLSLCISFFAFPGAPGQWVFHEADGHCYVEPDVVEDVPGGWTPAEYTARLDAEAHAAAAAGTPGEVFLCIRGPTVLSIPSGFLVVFEKPNRSSFTFTFTCARPPYFLPISFLSEQPTPHAGPP